MRELSPTVKAQIAIMGGTLALLSVLFYLDSRVNDVEREQLAAEQRTLKEEQQRQERTLTAAALASCERGNFVREVLYEIALELNRGANGEILQTLRGQPYINLKTGRVDCRLAVLRPKPLESR